MDFGTFENATASRHRQTLARSSPSIGGTKSVAPVAITTARASSVSSPTSTLCAPVNFASPNFTDTLSLLNISSYRAPRSPPPVSASATRCLYAITVLKSNDRSPNSIPRSRAPCERTNILATCNSALDGTHASLGHSPPNRPFSINHTRAPTPRAASTAENPAEPDPITITSNVPLIIFKIRFLRFPKDDHHQRP